MGSEAYSIRGGELPSARGLSWQDGYRGRLQTYSGPAEVRLDASGGARLVLKDGPAPLPCDALSFAIGLRGYEVGWGDPTPLASTPPLCP